MPKRILLVHGLLNANYWLAPMAARLRARGFEVEIFGYASLFGGPERAIRQLRQRLQRDPVDALIGHSLGGLVALEALRDAEGPTPRVVCLGTPLRGSRTARGVAAHRWTRPLLGRSARLLQAGVEAWGGSLEVGMVAGNVPRGMGRLFTRFEGDSDGTVALEETRMPGLADHCVVHSTHTGLVFSAEAVEQATHFLREGRFRH